MKRSTLAFLPLLLWLPTTAGAQAKLGVGLFAPDLPFSDAAARFQYVRGIATHLSAAMGVPVDGYAYKGAADLERDVRARRIHFAVLGALYTASQRGTVLAVAKVRGGEPVWTMLAKSKKSLLTDLRGKVVQVPAMGPLTSGFVQNALLGGNVDVKQHFRMELAPDVSSAVKAVQLGRADAVVAPANTPGLVSVIAGGLRMPPPAFVLVDRKVEAALVSKARAAMLSYGASVATLEGWRAETGLYAALASSTQKRTLDMALTPVEALRYRHDDVVDAKQLEVRLPQLEDLFWVP